MNPFLRHPSAYQRTPIRAEMPAPKSGDRGVVTLRLYDPIDSWGEEWGVSAKEFVGVLDDLPDDTEQIRLLINSPGGEAWEGLAILNALRAHPAKVTAVVEGIAGSAASFIAAGVDELHVMENSETFIHRAWGMCVGHGGDMNKTGADLEHLDRNLASIYAGKAGGKVDDWLAAMAGETFYSAEEAVQAGLADKVLKPAKGKGGASEARARFDLSVFARRDNVPRAEVAADPAPLLQPPTEPDPEPADDPRPDEGAPDVPAAEPEQPTEPKEDPVSDLSDIARGLGLPEDAGKDAILAAIEQRQPDDPNPTPEPEPDPEPEPEREPELVTTAPSASVAPAPAQPAADPALAQQVALLTEQMTAMSGQLAAANKEKAAAVKASVLDEAQRQGKFKPADRQAWDANYDKAPDVCASVLASIAPGTAVPISAAGVTGPAEPTEAEDRFDALFTRKVTA